MQIAYKTGVELSEYHRCEKEGSWDFPSFRDCCAICKGKDCAVKDGKYCRQAYDERGRLIKELGIQRYKCCRGKANKAVTFSLLPSQLAPYRKYSLRITTQVMITWRRYGKRIRETLDNVFSNWEYVDDELWNMGCAHIHHLRQLYNTARHKYVIWQKGKLSYSLEAFILKCSQDQCRRAEILSEEYYSGNGGWQNMSQFLFGTASQFRRSNL